MTRRRRRERTRDRIVAVLVAIVGIAMSAGAVWFYVAAKSHHEPLDEATNCPKSGPKAIQLILIDRSDPITPLQAERVRQELKRLTTGSAPGERFDVYVAEGDANSLLLPVVSICSPGQGPQASELYQNPERIQRRFEEQFARVLTSTVNSLLEPASRTTSPILESIKAASVASFGPYSQGQLRYRLTIISDMIQHTPALSHFRTPPSFETLARAPEWRSVQANLKQAEVTVYYLLRPSARHPNGQPVQTRGHQLFWEQAISASNGRVVLMESL